MKVTFNINFHTVWGQKLLIVGSVPQLGLWENGLAKEMYYTGDGNWQLQLEIPSDYTSIEYSYLLFSNEKQFFEEWEKKHRLEFDGRSTSYTLCDYWQARPANLAFYSSAFTKCLFAHPRSAYERVAHSGKKLVIKINAPQVEKSQLVAVTGNQHCLGNWQINKAVLLSCDTSPEWYVELDANEVTYPLEYKFFIWNNDTHELYSWEAGENRVFILPPQEEEEETVVISGLTLRDNLPLRRFAGSVIPVFSLRSEQSFGVGDLGDLRMMVDWVKQTHQRIIQVLPMNDTTSSRIWTDSYPYSAISIYALHPMYINLPMMGALKNEEQAAFYAAVQQELNAKEGVDYEAVNMHKLAYCREYFEQEGKEVLQTLAFNDFFHRNESWLMPYAAYCYLRDRFHTSNFMQWGAFAVYDESQIEQLTTEDSEAWPEIAFVYFLQYVLHTQFQAVSNYARQQGVVLKGDLPIGVNRISTDAWQEPHYFNMNGQAGAPPDDFSMIGQNWMFPTYNWEEMEKNNLLWWKKRFRKLGDYFDCFRIDHILGFFRIWEIPAEYVQGLCGHFNPALPLNKEEIAQYGMNFREDALTIPHLNRRFLPELFGALAEEVEQTYLALTTADYVTLKPFCDTQRKIEQLFAGKTDPTTLYVKEGLYAIANEVLFLRDPREPHKFHPRISGSISYVYKELDASDKYAFDHLYWDFFYSRHNNFWKAHAYERLTPLVASTEMLVCGEDLGMIPQTVPEVMNKLQILSLEIERMPKAPNREFSDLHNLPYLSVCTTSTHDMSPIRNWWKEDVEKVQRYYNQVLMQPGEAPDDCSATIAAQIIENHLASQSMLVILPLQDWFAMDDTIKREDIRPERINVPADPENNWNYRMHISLEQLMQADKLNEKIISLISKSDRK